MLVSIAEVMRAANERNSLPPQDARSPTGFEVTADWVTLWWGGYDYNIESCRIDTPEKLLGWLRHIGEKAWSGTTPERISRLIEALSARYGWHTTDM